MSLSVEEQFYYDNYYENALGHGLLGYIQKMIHKSLDSKLKKRTYKDVLEVGSGMLEHLKNSNILEIQNYNASDIRYTPNHSIFKQSFNFKNVKKLEITQADAEKLDSSDSRYDLLIATCLLIHLKNPEIALQEWRRVVKSGGELIIYVPCEPGFFLRLGRRIAVISKHKKLGFSNYNLVCAREHVSSLPRLNTLIKTVFANDKVKIKSWPIPLFRLWNFNLAYFYHIEVSKI